MNKRYLLFASLPFIVLPMVACQSNNSGEAAKAKTVAQQEDAQLSHDGYRPLHVPGFGKVDLGIKGSTYEVVFSGGKNPEVVRTLVDSANRHPEKGVTIKADGTLVVMDASSLSALKSAVKTVVKSAAL